MVSFSVTVPFESLIKEKDFYPHIVLNISGDSWSIWIGALALEFRLSLKPFGTRDLRSDPGIKIKSYMPSGWEQAAPSPGPLTWQAISHPSITRSNAYSLPPPVERATTAYVLHDTYFGMYHVSTQIFKRLFILPSTHSPLLPFTNWTSSLIWRHSYSFSDFIFLSPLQLK